MSQGIPAFRGLPQPQAAALTAEDPPAFQRLADITQAMAEPEAPETGEEGGHFAGLPTGPGSIMGTNMGPITAGIAADMNRTIP